MGWWHWQHYQNNNWILLVFQYFALISSNFPLPPFWTYLSNPINIIKCHSLQTGEHRLNIDQWRSCCSSDLTAVVYHYPNYKDFDVTLLYKLIRHLCPSLEPTNKWGNKPTRKDLSVGDDIERIRELRNACFAHTESAEISNDDFEELWKAAKSILFRLQQFTTSKGRKTNYIQMLLDLQRKALTFNEYISCRQLPGGKQSNLSH